jgi:hypothetical protein
MPSTFTKPQPTAAAIVFLVDHRSPGEERLALSPLAIRRAGFLLVLWRPVIDRQLSREVMGIVQGGSVSWQLGQPGLGLQVPANYLSRQGCILPIDLECALTRSFPWVVTKEGR